MQDDSPTDAARQCLKAWRGISLRGMLHWHDNPLESDTSHRRDDAINQSIEDIAGLVIAVEEAGPILEPSLPGIATQRGTDATPILIGHQAYPSFHEAAYEGSRQFLWLLRGATTPGWTKEPQVEPLAFDRERTRDQWDTVWWWFQKGILPSVEPHFQGIVAGIRMEEYRISQDSPAGRRRTSVPVYNDLQSKILTALDGRALKGEVLAEAVKISRVRLNAGGLNELMAEGVVIQDRAMGGYYRPDAPPEGLVRRSPVSDV